MNISIYFFILLLLTSCSCTEPNGVTYLLKHKIINEHSYDKPIPLLFISVMTNDTKSVKTLLKKGVNIKIKYDGYTPLIYSIKNNNIEMVKLLLEYGASINTNNSKNKIETPAMLYVNRVDEKKYKPMIELLLKHEVDINSLFRSPPLYPVFTQAIFSNAPNHFLIFLYKKGADINKKGESDRTPLIVATMLLNIRIVNLLL
jgi:ankyrin repeat protein